jgi:tetratricopeptide (TPR) repeat protein
MKPLRINIRLASFHSPFSGQLILGILLLLAAPSFVSAQASAPQISEALSGELGKLRELTEAQSFAPALVLIDRLLPTVQPDSYDRTLLSQIKAQIFLNQGRYAEAIAPLEEALRIGEARNHLTEAAARESLFLLAQLYQQQASESKDAARQHTLLTQAITYLRRWQARAPVPTPEGQLFTATLLYQQATLNPDHPDADALLSARLEAEKGLALQIKTPVSLYVLILAALQHSDDHRQAADILELLVEKSPDNVSYWQQLTSAYLNLAGSTKNPRESERYHLRALLTAERAQARGFLKSPKENFNRVALYLSLHQIESAITLLEKGLAHGSIENTRRNWELLASSHQQNQQETQAILALEKAVKALPDDGQLEFSLAQLLNTVSRMSDARRHLEAAVKKGRLDKPGQTRLFLAYTAYELRDYEAATHWTREAAPFADVNKDDLARLVKAIDDAVRTGKPQGA